MGVQVHLGHDTLIIAVKHDGETCYRFVSAQGESRGPGLFTSKEVDGSIHGLGILELYHPALAVPADEELFELPWFRIL